MASWFTSQAGCHSIIGPAQPAAAGCPGAASGPVTVAIQTVGPAKRRELDLERRDAVFHHWDATLKAFPLVHQSVRVCQAVSPSSAPAAGGLGAGGSRASRRRGVNLKWPLRRDNCVFTAGTRHP